MIPNFTSSRGFVLRLVSGVFSACRLLTTAAGHRISSACSSVSFERPDLLGTSRYFLAMAFPVLLFLVLAAIALQPHAALASITLAIVPPVVAKDGKAAEFRAEADKLRARIADPAITLTKDELNTALEGIRTFEARAAAVAEFTPRAEIDRQGGDEELQRANPDSNLASDDLKTTRSEMDELADSVRKIFGGPATYLRKLGERTVNTRAFNDKQEKLHARVQAFHKRYIGGEGTSGEGGGEFLLPLQQISKIFAVTGTQFGLANIATRYPVLGRTLRIPYMIQDKTGADADGGGSNTVSRPMHSIAAVDIIGEGDEKPERQPRFGQRLLTVYKLAAYTELGDETLADDFTGDLTPVTLQTIGGAIMDRVNEYVTADGSGSSQPLAALHASNAAIKVINRETSMSITTNDIFNMYAAHTFGNGQSAWLINRTALTKLMALTLGTNTLITWLPSLTGAPQMMLLGLPIYMTDLTPVLGVKGDLALVNGGFYAMALRQALTIESSIHYKFRNDLTAYRAVTRFGGIPIPTSTYAYKASGATKIAEHSPFVVLGDDATS